MKKVFSVTGFVLLIAILLAAGMVPASVFADGQNTPYKAGGPEEVVQEAPHPDCGPTRLKVDIKGSGQATYLGQYSIIRQHCFNPATATFEEGRFEKTAASGDKIWGTYSGTVVNVLEFAEDGSPVVVVIHSPWTINGGTGRFFDAEGSGNAVGVFNLVTKEGRFDIEGWISDPVTKK